MCVCVWGGGAMCEGVGGICVCVCACVRARVPSIRLISADWVTK